MMKEKNIKKIPLTYIFHFIQFALILVLIVQMGLLLKRIPGPNDRHRQEAKMQKPIELDIDMDEFTQNSPSLGNSDAKVTFVLFNSFSCGYCNRARETIMRLYNENKDKMRIVYKHFNRGMEDMEAAIAVECAGEQGKFWDMYNNIFNYNGQMPIDAIAKKTGLNIASYKKCIASGKYKSKIEGDTQKGSHIGIRGTPSFVINGKLVVGALPYEHFKKIIEDEM